MTWRVARSLDVLLAEINAQAPGRSTISDGSIGDAAHASRESDHNPWVVVNGVGVVRARDFTHDPSGGLDCNDLARSLVELYGQHPAMGSGAYTIWNRRIYSYDRRAEGWRPYYGSNPHDHHLHQSVALSASGFDSTRPWGVTTEGDDMTPDQVRTEVKAAIREMLPEIGQETTSTLLGADLTPHNEKPNDRSVRSVLNGIAGRIGRGGPTK